MYVLVRHAYGVLLYTRLVCVMHAYGVSLLTVQVLVRHAYGPSLYTVHVWVTQTHPCPYNTLPLLITVSRLSISQLFMA